ncbi:MAG: sigma-70 family RNA polymerase sigma factor [Opitutae bacterium]|nr:sigma-70 family RNA polymerase sigma factor [Opitutae bacterium]
MKAPEIMALLHAASDADLVTACQGGNRSAFEQIVGRYQRLLCSLAYSALGDIAASEDVAQETFVTAWLKLGELREPEKLRSWLCAILRFKISHARRSAGREPVCDATPLDGALELPSEDASADETAMARDEQALVWRALRTLPEIYREPLVLFYREHGSIEHVAAELDLTEDAVKQRLARGRKLLKDQVLALVEGALARSTPGRVFTFGVLAALPALTPPAQAAAVGAAAVATKGVGGLAKLAAFAALLASVSGFVTTVMTLRMNLDQARTARERRAVVVVTAVLFGSFVGFLLFVFALRVAAARWPDRLPAIAAVHHAAVVAFAAGWSLALLRSLRFSSELRTAERRREPEKFSHPADRAGSRQSEYRSRATLLGLPLVHVRFSTPDAGQGPALGWIAGGDRAVGLLFAYGGWAVGGVSVGGVTFGLVSLGAVSTGVLSLGAICFGGVAFGSVSVGWRVFGSLSATAWETAQSLGLAFSHFVAAGPFALAPHANDEFARRFLANPHADREWLIFCTLTALLALVPTTLYVRAARRRMSRLAAPDTPPS